LATLSAQQPQPARTSHKSLHATNAQALFFIKRLCRRRRRRLRRRFFVYEHSQSVKLIISKQKQHNDRTLANRFSPKVKVKSIRKSFFIVEINCFHYADILKKIRKIHTVESCFS